MTIDDFSGPREFRGTVPRDPRNPPRFGQLIETVKDAFAAELYRFFERNSDDIRAKLGEFPTIEKFGVGAGSTSDSMETVMNLVMSYGDAMDKYPMIAITSANYKERSLGLGGNLVSSGQSDPGVTSSNSGPFVLLNDWELRLRSWPQGLNSPSVDSLYILKDFMFSDISNATADDVAKVINGQALYMRAQATADGRLRISAGGPCASGEKNGVEVIGGSPDLLLALGYTVGQSDKYTDHSSGSASPMLRHSISGDMVVNIDVISDDLNTRTQLADLVMDFFTFYNDRNFYQLQGRSYQDETIDPPEWYQIILNRNFSWSGEYARPRQGGEQKSYLYSIRGSVPILAIDYVNRPLNRGAATFVEPSNIVQTESLPQGDYFGPNYLD